MKKLFLLFGVLAFVFACGQEKKQSININIMNTNYPDINTQNIEQRLLKNFYKVKNCFNLEQLFYFYKD